MRMYSAFPSLGRVGVQKSGKFLGLHHCSRGFVSVCGEVVTPPKKTLGLLGKQWDVSAQERRCGVEEVPGDEGAMAPSWLLVLGVFFPLTPPFWYLFIPNYCFYLIKGGGHEVAVSSAPALCLRMRLSDFMLIMV